MAENEPFPETPRLDPKAVLARHEAVGAGTGTAAGEGQEHAQGPMGRARPVKVTVPEVTLTDQQGAEVNVKEVLEGDAPVILTFMFTSCTTSCPVMAATVAQVQRDLGAEAERVRFVSISIDPEQDTPERMRAFLATHGASARWRFLTGTAEKSHALQRAFDVYRGNKQAHPPGYFIRDPKSGAWWRIGGLASAEVVTGEYRRLAGQSD
jgi:protein SCO1/2